MIFRAVQTRGMRPTVRISPFSMASWGRLARQGFVNKRSQGLEIIHDFFSEVWPELGERFDPEQGTMDGYVTGAFARFARRRLVREAFWFRHLETEPSASMRGRAAATEIDPVDRQRLRDAVQALSDEDRELLQERYGQDELSERELARVRGWTRYHVRDRLARALIRVSCQFGDSGMLSASELSVARELFAEGRDLNYVANSFDMTEAQVRLMRSRILKAIGQVVGGSS